MEVDAAIQDERAVKFDLYTCGRLRILISFLPNMRSQMREKARPIFAESCLPSASTIRRYTCGRDLWSASAGFGRFSLSASSWCVRWPGRATPTRWVRPGSRRWQPFRDLQGRTVQPGHRFGAYRHRLQLSLPMRGTRASAHTALRMRRAAKLASIQAVMTKQSKDAALCSARVSSGQSAD